LPDEPSPALARLAALPFAPRGDRPVWLQIADRLREACRKRLLHEGERLPGENRMAEAFGVTRVTLRRALGVLQQEGLLEARKGVGIFVRPVPLRYVVDHGSRFADGIAPGAAVVGVRTLALGRGPASAEEAAALDLASGTSVIRLDRLRLLDGAPVYRTHKVFPADLFPGFEDAYAMRESVRDTYAAHGLPRYRRAETRVSGGFADLAEAADLRLTPHTPVLRTVALNISPSGRTIEFNSGTWLLTAVELVLRDPAAARPDQGDDDDPAAR
jgi:phosphonate metabolism transcriptional regulator PhnF